jgi:hypothetical protein
MGIARDTGARRSEGTSASPFVDEALTLARSAKERGNKRFTAKQYGEAVREYSAALEALDNRAAGGDPVDEAFLRGTVLANRAAAWLLADDAAGADAATAARDDCTAALVALERAGTGAQGAAPTFRKALFRRALAHEQLGAPAPAVDDLVRVVGAQAAAGEHPSDDAMGALHRILSAGPLPADEALGRVVEVLVAVLGRGLDVGGLEAEHAAPAPSAGATVAAPGANLVSPEHKQVGYTLVLAILTARDGARSAPMRAFVASQGPRVAHTHLHSMEGDWMADAKRGTLRAVDALVRMPTIRAAVAALDLSAHGLHAPPPDAAGAHGVGCTH